VEYRSGIEMKVRRMEIAVFVSAIVGLAIVTSPAYAQREYVSAQTELLIVVHEDSSITLKTLDGTEIKGFANVNALAGPNGLVDMIEQMELWNN
jgi:hypothetical protein